MLELQGLLSFILFISTFLFILGTVNDDPYPENKGSVKKRVLIIFSVAIVVALIVAGLAYIFVNQEDNDSKTICLYGFSVKGEVFDEKVIPAFVQYWQDKTGERIEFETTYAGSGTITKQVLTGAPAEVMIVSTEWDAIQLRKNGFVTTDWNDFPYNGTVSKSPWVIMTRAGNPYNITDFDDLTAPSIEIIHADPVTSGGACWSIFSVYGSELMVTNATGTPDEDAATDLLEGVIDNVISWQSSARQALSQFVLGYGDAFITYENDALLSIENGNDFEIVYPRSTIYSEHKVVMVDENINDDEREVIEEFVNFLFTNEVQEDMAEYNFRSVIDDVNNGQTKFPPIEMPFTVEYLGGWETAHAELIDEIFVQLRE